MSDIWWVTTIHHLVKMTNCSVCEIFPFINTHECKQVLLCCQKCNWTINMKYVCMGLRAQKELLWNNSSLPVICQAWTAFCGQSATDRSHGEKNGKLILEERVLGRLSWVMLPVLSAVIKRELSRRRIDLKEPEFISTC